jgi:hypothetical protein
MTARHDGGRAEIALLKADSDSTGVRLEGLLAAMVAEMMFGVDECGREFARVSRNSLSNVCACV